MSVRNETYKLSNGVKIPKLAIGTWQVPEGEVVYNVVSVALQNGYRHVDTAVAYGNENSVGKAIRESKIKREEIFVTTKVPAEVKSYEEAVETIQTSLKTLNVEYIDLMLIHAPKPWAEMHAGSTKNYDEANVLVWKALEEAYQSGKIKAIGVSNFSVPDLENILAHCSIAPMTNQIRYFIGNTQEEITQFCQSRGILVEAYSPLATGEIFNNVKIADIAKKYNKSISQICIRYILQKGVLPLPKSTHEQYIIQNAEVDFEIDSADMQYLDQL